MNQRLAFTIGRPDMAELTSAFTLGLAPVVGGGEPDGMRGGPGGLAARAEFTGRVSAAFIGLIVVGFAGFYVWTRAYQA